MAKGRTSLFGKRRVFRSIAARKKSNIRAIVMQERLIMVVIVWPS